jgi:hypothetical protein
MTRLPTVDEMLVGALRELDKARNAMSGARDWVKSDTRPLGAPRTPTQRQAADTVLDVVGEIKDLIDDAKSAIYQALDEAEHRNTASDEDSDGVT